MQMTKIPRQFVSSIEEIEIKLHFLNLDIAPNGRETFGRRIAFWQIRFAGSIFRDLGLSAVCFLF
jgi:hypothetical protein